MTGNRLVRAVEHRPGMWLLYWSNGDMTSANAEQYEKVLKRQELMFQTDPPDAA